MQSLFHLDSTSDTLQSNSNKKKRKWFQYLLTLASKMLVFWGLMILTAVVTYLIFFVRTKTVVVPDITGKELSTAMLELQKKNLYAEISEQYTTDPSDRGRVLSQDPSFGINVRERRVIKLIVSKGSVVSVMPAFVGYTLSEVSLDPDNVFSGLGQYFDIGLISKMFDSSAPGTVLGQYPIPKTKLSQSFTEVNLVVSRGSRENASYFPDFLGLDFTEIFPLIEQHSPEFDFYFVDDDNVQLDTEKEEALLRSGVILEQAPQSGMPINSDSYFYIGLRRNNIIRKGAEGGEENTDAQYPTVEIFEVNLTRYEREHEITIIRSYTVPAANSSSDVNAASGDASQTESSDESRDLSQKPLVKVEEEYLKFLSHGGSLSIPYFSRPGDSYSVRRFGQVVWFYTITTPRAVTTEQKEAEQRE